MLALIAVMTLGQLSDPPLLPADSSLEALIPPPTPPPELSPPPAMKAEDPKRSYDALNLSFMKELELHRQISAVSLQIAELDVSGPGWASGLRTLGYFLVVPAFLFIAPVVSGNSVAVGAVTAVAPTHTLAPTFNTLGIVLTVVTAIALTVGIGAGVMGWILKRWEMDALVARKGSLEQQLDAAVRSRR